MFKLWKYEWKKIFCKRSNIILLLVLVALTGLQLYQNVFHNGTLVTETVNEKGEAIHGISYYKFAYQQQVAFEGDMNTEWINRVKNQNRSLREDFVDKEKMQLAYGDRWIELMEKNEQGILSKEDIRYAQQCLEDANITPNEHTPLFTIFYNQLDYKMTLTSSFDTNYGFLGLPKDKNRVIKKEKFNNPATACFSTAICSLDRYNNSADINYFNNRYLENPTNYYPTVGKDAYLAYLSSYTILSFLVLAILVANIFTSEKQLKTDCLVVPTKYGWKKIALLKMSVALTLCMGVTIFNISLFGIIFGLSVGFSSWDQTMFLLKFASITDYLFTYKEVLIAGVSAIIIASFAFCSVMMFLSERMKNAYAVIVITLLFIILPYFSLNSLFQDTIMIDQWFPSGFLRFTDFFDMTYVFGDTSNMLVTFGNRSTLIVYPILLGWVVISAMLLYATKHHYQKHHVENA